ncbi:hypothetical protein D3D02_14395 [Halobellus sp. Atlit-38R]|uniref:hypothetical protein n=1 Tax=Halobellus sp. Atlit-38R TaxID=2282131 RepID=UPI000EF21D3F|nr:hypothetical protein [Halobellus sp. Atlit-38R]RLM84232.1 hypothetical protein D3D02_14395 [Halobellus sp. Atlit-38R]
MRSRRTVLTGLGTIGVTGLAGCAALPFGDDHSDNEDVPLSTGDIGTVTWPESPFPVAVPPSLVNAHRDRSRELLAAVPSDPSVPNGAVAEEVQSDRERTANQLNGEPDESWPTEALSTWRGRRNEAACVLGTYRAATGKDDAEALTERQQGVRNDLASFVADHEYRASSPLEAVLAHAPIEELVGDCRRHVRPAPAYPSDPVASPFQAGDAVGRVELARATLADARRLREAYLGERSETTAQWTALIDASRRLEYAASRTRSSVTDFLDREESPFRTDLDGTAGRWLFRRASGYLEAKTEEAREHRNDGQFAAAVIEAGQILAGVEALRATINGIRDGAYLGEVTTESVSGTADRAREAITAIGESDNPRVAAQIVRPTLGTFEYITNLIKEHYAEAVRVEGDLAWAELYARAVPAAAEFVVERLE